MPSLSTARRIASIKNNGAKTIGQIHKENSDFIMEQTWDADIQSKVCYIYDHKHDNQPNLNSHMTYENTTKTRIDAKFIVSQYGSISKDQVAFHIMFKSSERLEFAELDDLYYFETDYRKKYNVEFPVSLYIDIPNEKGIYEKWLIITAEQGNQFTKFNVLPCNYLFEWIEVSGQDRLKRRMWGVERQQLSYTSGVWRDYNFESLDNVDKAFLPLNEITKNLWYVGDDDKNQRMIISAKVDRPLVWRITKLENTKPFGILQLTFSQTSFDEHNDYIEKDKDGNIIGMWADYHNLEIKPTDPVEPSPTPLSNYGTITASTSTIKIGGSYKTLTVNLYDEGGVDITNSYTDALFTWTYNVDGADIDNLVTWLDGTSFNKKKVKFANDRNYLEKLLEIKCEVAKENETPIEIVMQFELIV